MWGWQQSMRPDKRSLHLQTVQFMSTLHMHIHIYCLLFMYICTRDYLPTYIHNHTYSNINQHNSMHNFFSWWRLESLSKLWQLVIEDFQHFKISSSVIPPRRRFPVPLLYCLLLCYHTYHSMVRSRWCSCVCGMLRIWPMSSGVHERLQVRSSCSSAVLSQPLQIQISCRSLVHHHYLLVHVCRWDIRQLDNFKNMTHKRLNRKWS